MMRTGLFKTVRQSKHTLRQRFCLNVVAPHKGFCIGLACCLFAAFPALADIDVYDANQLRKNNWGLWIGLDELSVVPLQNVICNIHSEDEPKQISSGQYQVKLAPLTDSLKCKIAPIPERSDDTSTVPEEAGQ